MGLDVGISSVGWGLIKVDENNNPCQILDVGVKIFSPGEVPKTGASKNLVRREKRGSRRIIRRREFRVDRVKHLLNLNGYLGENIESGIVSEVNEKLSFIFDSMLNKYYKEKNVTPYQLKVEALDRKLTKDELSIILVHYAKHRGYKSNRDEDKNDSETGKVKSAIDTNKKIMEVEGYRSPSEMFLKDKRFDEKIRNSNGDYKLSITREMYLNEIELVLDTQIKYGLITEEFKKDYIEIWSSQRHYAKGPGGDSKYGGDLIARMTGKCKFDGKPRAPKCAPSSEIFVALMTLINLRYKNGRNDEYRALSADQISKIIEVAKVQDTVTYAKIFKELGIDNGIVKGLSATNKEKNSAVKAYMKKFGVEVFNLNTDNEYALYDSLKINEINKREVVSLKNYSKIRKEFIKNLGISKWEEISDNYELLDLIVEILTNYKLDDDVINAVKENNINDLYLDSILNLPNFKDHLMLSLDLLKKLNNLMINGVTYDEAMKQLGYNHSDLDVDKEKFDLLIPINQDEELTNQRVIRSLAQARGILNSIIKKYGMPERINIETARELSKSREERNEISKNRDKNREENDKVKEQLVSLGLFKSIDGIKSHDLLKYRLWNEQQNRCTYSLETIKIEDLFDNNLVQVDHILPYSRTFDDSYYNKTLVLTKYNQDKGNKTPFEWIGNTEKWNVFKNFIVNLDISERKKENYLLNKLTLEMESEYRNQNLNDTKFISKYLVSYIKANLNVPKVGCPSGSITGKIRNYWHLNGLTHSLESETYYKNDGDDAKKNRENHLHHAMDALIIAVANDGVIRRVSNYERFRRYLDNKPLNEIINYANNANDDFDINSYVDEYGVLNEISLKEYIKELRDKEFFVSKKNNSIKTYVPEPYEGFANEAKIRVYEQDKKIMDFKLKEYNYSNDDLNNAVPIIPKFAKDKIGGSLHGETYYSLRTRKSGQDEVVSKVSRVDIASSSFDGKKLECILDKDSGSKEVYNTILQWLSNSSNGADAFKRNGGYPVNPKTANLIKKIRIANDYDGKGHIIDGKVVDKENICQIDVYLKKGEEKLYFVGYDAMDLFQIKEKKNKDGKIVKESINIDVDLWYGQGSNHILMKYNDLIKNYDYVVSLRKNDYIEIELRTGNKGRGYVCGCSSGLFEVKSAIGDGVDLIGEDKLFTNLKDRFQITVSTIKSIDVLKINNLGKIE